MSGIQQEHKTVNQTAARASIAGGVLRAFHIDPSNLSLAQAAALTSSNPDEVLAILEAKIRRAAVHNQLFS